MKVLFAALALYCLILVFYVVTRDDSDPVLQLRGQDATEEVLRAAYRADRAADPQAWITICGIVTAAPTPEIALGWMGAFRRPEERLPPAHPDYVQPRIMAGAVAKPGQEGSYRDKVRMAEILIEECSA